MSDRQDQRVGNNGFAAQAGGHLTINNGVSPAQMSEILIGLATQIASYEQQAKDTVEKRLSAFRDEIIQIFTDPKKGRAEAFCDPDFQYLLLESQKSFSRSGDIELERTLVDIIARRSLETHRTRLAITLNEAAATAPLLTKHEFSALSLAFIISKTKRNDVINIRTLHDYLNTSVINFVEESWEHEYSIAHLEAVGCGSVGVRRASLREILVRHYGGLLGFGSDEDSYSSSVSQIPRTELPKYLIRCLRNPENLQPNAINREHFLELHSGKGLDRGQCESLWGVYLGSIPDREKMTELLIPDVPRIGELFSAWDDTQLNLFDINAKGIAIGHANAVSKTAFDGDISIWVR